MRTSVETLSPRALSIAAAAGVLVYALLLWFVVVSPKRSETARLGEELAAAEIRLVEAQAAAHRPQGAGVPVSDLLRLAKAMPSSSDQPGLVLELARLATAAGVTLSSITPQAPVEGTGGATMIPVAVTVGGSFYEISDFLYRTRSLVTVRDGKLRATGRLFVVQNVELVESITEGFPMLDGTITLNAYVYDGPIAAAGERKGEESPGGELPSPPNGAAAVGRTG